jgi:C4-dicarboxylate transporter DctQ subunit
MKIRRITDIFDRCLNIMFVFAGVLLIIIMVIMSAGVTSRYLLNLPLGWVTEVVEYSLLYIGFLAAPLVLKREGHVKMELVLGRLSPKAQLILEIITSAICVIICFVLFWFGLRVTWELYETHYTTPTVLELPKFIFVAVIFVGSIALCFQFIIRVFGFISSWNALRHKAKGP